MTEWLGSYANAYGYVDEYRDMTTAKVPSERTIPVPLRARVLDEAKALITGDRNKSYGSPVQNFQNTADMWNVQFRHKLKADAVFTPSDVAQAMVLLKMARMIAGDKHDNYVDAIGYAACGAECAEHERR